MRIVLANGVFDILHAGHVAHLRQAREMGDILVVSLTEDEFTNRNRPVNKWIDRATVLRELRCVGYVFGTPNAVTAIKMIRPAVFVKGIDYANGRFTEDVEMACLGVGAEIRFTDTPKQSSTEIYERQRKVR